MDVFDQYRESKAEPSSEDSGLQAMADEAVSAREFLVNEFRYKCTAGPDGNVRELIAPSPYPKEAQQMPAPRNPAFADHLDKPGAEPGKQELKFTDLYEQEGALEKGKEKARQAESPDPCI